MELLTLIAFGLFLIASYSFALFIGYSIGKQQSLKVTSKEIFTTPLFRSKATASSLGDILAKEEYDSSKRATHEAIREAKLLDY